MSATRDRPLITFAVIAYNQEHFIREAVEGAFAQTYSPLEIILSDDCSQDGTFEIMREMASSYRGPHRIRLNRNERNLGIVPHVNRIFALAAGELIVMAAGDDQSCPQRTAALVTAWLDGSKRADGLCSGYVALNGKREQVVTPPHDFSAIRHCRAGTSRLLGATAAWARRLLDVWGPLPDDALAEDQVLTLRALLSGGISIIASPLIRSRRSDGRTNHLSVWEQRWWTVRRDAAFCDVYARDLAEYRVRNPASAKQLETLLGELTRAQRRHRLAANLLAGGPLCRLAFSLLYLFSERVAGKATIRARLRPTLRMLRALFAKQFTASREKFRNHRYLRN